MYLLLLLSPSDALLKSDATMQWEWAQPKIFRRLSSIMSDLSENSVNIVEMLGIKKFQTNLLYRFVLKFRCFEKYAHKNCSVIILSAANRSKLYKSWFFIINYYKSNCVYVVIALSTTGTRISFQHFIHDTSATRDTLMRSSKISKIYFTDLPSG